MENLLKVESSNRGVSVLHYENLRKPNAHRLVALAARRAEPTPPSQGGGTGSNPESQLVLL
jgi:hypothetical protein